MSSFWTMSLMMCAGSRPSVRSAGLLGSVPTNTIVGSPWICNNQGTSSRQNGHVYNASWTDSLIAPAIIQALNITP